MLALGVAAPGCGESRAASVEPTSAPSSDAPSPSPEEREPIAMLDPDSDCGRAELCCRAYADAIPNVVAASACVGPREASEMRDAADRCRRMRDGWRAALEHLGSGDLPAACGDK